MMEPIEPTASCVRSLKVSESFAGRALACLALCGLLQGPLLLAQDWPHWLGPGRNATVSGFLAPAQWPASLTQQWRRTVGLGESTPALEGNRLYAFTRQEDEEVILSLNTRDGSELWRYSYPAIAVTGPAKPYPGPRSSPAVADGKLIALGVGGVLTCLDADSGRLIWKRDDLTNDIPRFFNSASPLVVEGLCVVYLGGVDKGCLHAVGLNDGKSRWQWEGEPPSYSSAVPLTLGVSTQVVLLTEKNLRGISLTDGKPLWRIPTPLNPGYWNSATPMVDGPRVYYSGQGTGTRAVNVENPDQTGTPRQIWHNAQVGTVYNTPILHEDLLFGISDRGRFFCLEALTGKTVWVRTNRVSNFGTVLKAGGVLVGLPEHSDLVFFKPSRQGYEELAHYRVSDTPLYSFPLLSGNKIFIRDRDSITLWTMDRKVPE